jgi:hypothetical protein
MKKAIIYTLLLSNLALLGLERSGHHLPPKLLFLANYALTIKYIAGAFWNEFFLDRVPGVLIFPYKYFAMIFLNSIVFLVPGVVIGNLLSLKHRKQRTPSGEENCR